MARPKIPEDMVSILIRLRDDEFERYQQLPSQDLLKTIQSFKSPKCIRRRTRRVRVPATIYEAAVKAADRLGVHPVDVLRIASEKCSESQASTG